MPLSRIPVELGTTAVGFRNRIINGDMRIDQRNAGASVTISAALALYTVDRWIARSPTGGGTFTVQRSTTSTANFKNSLLCTVTSAATPGASDIYFLQQRIEGFNVADLMLGTASAQAFTVSFWVRSSVTGTFGASVGNNIDQSYPFSFTINSANTFEQKTVTIPGSTSGTWDTTTGVGLLLSFSLGAGSSVTGTANTWGNYPFAPTGSVNLISTSGATFYITGVQLEAGSVASPFERRDYGRELIMCQRYFQQLPSNRTDAGFMVLSSPVLGGSDRIPLPVLPVPLRTSPTVVSFRSNGTTTGETTEFSSNTNRVVTSIPNVDACGGGYLQSSTSFSNPARLNLTYSAEL
jgi:hypothetical protein